MMGIDKSALALATGGLMIRLLINTCFDSYYLSSLSYNSLDDFDNVIEGVHLLRARKPVYDNDIVHQTPHVLLFFYSMLKLFSNSVSLFLILETISFISVYILAQAISGSKLTARKVLAVYAFNPYSIISCSVQSASVFSGLALTWALYGIITNRGYLGAAVCAVGAYLSLYPGLLIIPLLFQQIKKPFTFVSSLGIFAITFCSLAASSVLICEDGLDFFNAVHLHQIHVADTSPQYGMFWYLFAELFDHFRLFFVWTFQLITLCSVIAITLKFYSDPVFQCLMVTYCFVIMRPYSSIGELGLLLSLLVVFADLRQYFRMSTVWLLLLTSGLILAPLFHHAWIHTGSANANFYFSSCLVQSLGQVFIMSDLLSAKAKKPLFDRFGEALTHPTKPTHRLSMQ